MPAVSCRCRFPSFLYRVYQPPAHAKKTPVAIAAVEWSAIPNDVGEEAAQRHSPLFRRSRRYLAHIDPNLDAVRCPRVHEAQGLRLPRL